MNYDQEPCDRIESICCCSRCRSLRAFDEETKAMNEADAPPYPSVDAVDAWMNRVYGPATLIG